MKIENTMSLQKPKEKKTQQFFLKLSQFFNKWKKLHAESAEDETADIKFIHFLIMIFFLQHLHFFIFFFFSLMPLLPSSFFYYIPLCIFFLFIHSRLLYLMPLSFLLFLSHYPWRWIHYNFHFFIMLDVLWINVMYKHGWILYALFIAWIR